MAAAARCALAAGGTPRRLCVAAEPLRFASSAAQPSRPPLEVLGQRRLLYRRLSRLGGDRAGAVAVTLDSWVAEKRPLSEVELLRCVRDLRRYDRHGHALELMDWMEARGMNISSGNQAMRLNLIADVRGIDAAESYFLRLPEACKDVKTYSALLNCYAKMKMEEEAVELYKKMRELDLTFTSALVHNSLMTLYIKSGQPEKVRVLFEEMKANNVAPDNYTYSILMQGYASLNDLESAEKLVEGLEESGARLEWYVYTTLAAHHNSAGQFMKAEAALKKAEALMGKDHAMAFNYLISLYAGAGNLAEVKRVWVVLKSFFPVPINRCYLDMLRALSRLDDIESLRKCYEEWEHHQTHFDVRLTNVLVTALLKKDMVDDAVDAWGRAMAAGRSNCATFHLFIEYYLRKRQFNLASKCLEAEINWAKKHNWSSDQMPSQEFLDRIVANADGSEVIGELLRKMKCLTAAETRNVTCQ